MTRLGDYERLKELSRGPSHVAWPGLGTTGRPGPQVHLLAEAAAALLAKPNT